MWDGGSLMILLVKGMIIKDSKSELCFIFIFWDRFVN